MRRFLHVLATSLTVLLTGFATGLPITQAAAWPPPPSRLHLSTPQGQLRIITNDYVYEARLQFEGEDVRPSIRGLLNITYAFKTESSTTALLSINTGNSPCDIHYRWILLQGDSYQLSPQFGSCSERIRVSADERGYTLSTPNPKTANMLDVYHYDGKQITLTQQAVPTGPTIDTPPSVSPSTQP